MRRRGCSPASSWWRSSPALVTFGFTKLRRRMGVGMTSRTWGITFLVTVLIILGLWAAGHG